MKKLILLFALISSTCFSQVWRHDVNVRQYLDKNTGQYVNEETPDSTFQMPDCTGLQMDLYADNELFIFIGDSAKGNYLTMMMKCLADGEKSGLNIDAFNYLLDKCEIPFTADLRKRFNKILSKNNFAKQL